MRSLYLLITTLLILLPTQTIQLTPSFPRRRFIDIVGGNAVAAGKVAVAGTVFNAAVSFFVFFFYSNNIFFFEEEEGDWKCFYIRNNKTRNTHTATQFAKKFRVYYCFIYIF